MAKMSDSKTGVDATSRPKAASSAVRAAGNAIEAGRATTSSRFKALTSQRRKNISTGDFAIPERRAFPIQSKDQAKVALRFVNAKRGNPADFPRVLAAIRRKYPDLLG